MCSAPDESTKGTEQQRIPGSHVSQPLLTNIYLLEAHVRNLCTVFSVLGTVLLGCVQFYASLYLQNVYLVLFYTIIHTLDILQLLYYITIRHRPTTQYEYTPLTMLWYSLLTELRASSSGLVAD